MHNWFILVVIVLLFVLPFMLPTIKPQPREGGTCTKENCGALDPVNDPDYNLRNVVKQSILLEEHLAEANKYCKSCIVKHFLHIIGLLEEAVWLAGSDVDKYPYLSDSVDYYQRALDAWLPQRDNEEVRKQVLSVLRERRRQLIDVYFLR